MSNSDTSTTAAAGPALTEGLGPLRERVAAAGCPPPGWLAPGVVPSLVGRTYTQSELDAAVAAERERCANLVRNAEADHGLCCSHCEALADLISGLGTLVMRPDGTWNRDREACRELAAEALVRYDVA